MKKIVLLCSQGLSTSALVQKMKEVCERNNLDYEINAYALDTAEETAADADCILIGPQMGYKVNQVRALFKDKPVEVIDMSAYGMLDGKAVVKMARKMMGVTK